MKKYIISNSVINNELNSKGVFIFKEGRKIVARLYNREVFYPLNNIKSTYSEKYSLELTQLSVAKSSNNIHELIFDLQKYTNIII